MDDPRSSRFGKTQLMVAECAVNSYLEEYVADDESKPNVIHHNKASSSSK